MSKKNTLEQKAKRRLLRASRKARAQGMVTKRSMSVQVKDKYGRIQFKSVFIPVSKGI